MPSILYIDNPTFEGRSELAEAMKARLGAEVVLAESIEEFAQKILQKKFDLYVCGDSMLFQGKIVQGWEALRKFLRQKEDLMKLAVLSNRTSVVEDAQLSQVTAFNKKTGFEDFLQYAKTFLDTAV
ncbi:MAG: hypothetical protein AB1405_12985 [Bdellovibrionota bacterium]